MGQGGTRLYFVKRVDQTFIHRNGRTLGCKCQSFASGFECRQAQLQKCRQVNGHSLQYCSGFRWLPFQEYPVSGPQIDELCFPLSTKPKLVFMFERVKPHGLVVAAMLAKVMIENNLKD